MKTIFIAILLLIITFLNPLELLKIDFNNVLLILFFLIFVFSIVWLVFSKNKENKYFFKEVFLLSLLFIISSIFINNFVLEHLEEENIFLRAYGQIAFFFFAWALIISPIIKILEIKNWTLKENLILFRKVFWILTSVFFVKHWLEYFAMDYYFYEKYPQNISFFEYIYNNLLKRYDALSWIVAWVFIFLLWITSNKFSVKLLWKYWKYLQMLAYPTFVITLLHIAFSWRFDDKYIGLLLLVVWLRTWAYFKDKNKIKTWKVKYLCVPCGYIYDEDLWDPDGGIPPWTKFEDIPDDWVCPVCWVWKKDFIPIYENEEKEIQSKVIDKTFLTDDVVELVIETEKTLQSKPGQFAKIILQDRDGKFKRAYSIVNQSKNRLTFCIKALETWRWGKIIRKLKKWDEITIEGIFWNFILKETENPKVFIATWTWLAPIINMIDNSKSKDNKLFFWVQKQKNLFYLDKILHKNNLQTEIFLSKEKTDKYNSGRINLDNYDFSKDTEFYICGNLYMVESMKKYLKEKWYKYIFFEKFTI